MYRPTSAALWGLLKYRKHVFYSTIQRGCDRCISKQSIHRHQTPRPGIKTPLVVVGWGWAVHASPYGPLRPDVTSSIKPEVHSVSQRRPRRTEPRPQAICTKNFLKIGRAFPEICSRTDRHTQTDRQTDYNRPLPYRGGVNRDQWCFKPIAS